MAIGFISKKARLGSRCIVSPTAKILGYSEIGDNTIVDDNVVVGYPTRRSIHSALSRIERVENIYEFFDSVSSGARIGVSCHLRPGTVVYERTVIGNYVETGHNVMIREDCVIGDNTVIGTLSVIDGRVRIGKSVRIETGVYIPPESVVEDNVFIGPYAVVTNDRYPMSKKLKGVYIEKGAVIGANCVLVAGIRIGENAVVAAGSVVTKDVPPNTVVAGVPAKPLYSRDVYDEKKRLWEEKTL